jgi:hypothetical protein
MKVLLPVGSATAGPCSLPPEPLLPGIMADALRLSKNFLFLPPERQQEAAWLPALSLGVCAILGLGENGGKLRPTGLPAGGDDRRQAAMPLSPAAQSPDVMQMPRAWRSLRVCAKSDQSQG